MANPIATWRKHSQSIEKIEMYKAQEYARGCDETADKFKKQVTSMTNKIQELAQQNIETEARMRDRSDKRVEHFERLQEQRCEKCREGLEAERVRLTRRQAMLATKLENVDDLLVRLSKHAEAIFDGYGTILKASGRVQSHMDVLERFKVEMDGLIDSSALLLSYDMSDLKEDKAGGPTGKTE
jgi:chromosome segregation ATPase